MQTQKICWEDKTVFVPKFIFPALGLKSETELSYVSHIFGHAVKCFSITQNTKKTGNGSCETTAFRGLSAEERSTNDLNYISYYCF